MARARLQPKPSQPAGERRYLLERVGSGAVAQIYADGFERLTREQKELAFHLAEAAIAGRDIFLDQRYAPALEMRRWLEALFVRRERLPEKARAEIERYLKLFWIHSGPHDHLTSRKERFGLSKAELADAFERAEVRGAPLDRLFDEWLNADVDPISTCKSPGPGQDILQASAANLYRGVTMRDVEGFAERHPLNSRLVKRADGALEEEVYRCGDGGAIPPGLYADRIARVVAHLEDAIRVAPPATARALERLVRFYRTGEAGDFREHTIAWVEDRDAVVDTVNGFIEVYVDPRGQKGAWEGIVACVNPEKTKAIRALADDAAWFEARMPWDPKWRKPDVKGIAASAIDVICETGDAGPVTAVGINLPNAQDVREQHGSKSVSLSNVAEAYEKSTLPEVRRELCFDDAEFRRSLAWSAASSEIHTNMHEVIGHASGRVAERPADALRQYASTLEEARADLVALWFIGDPDTVARGHSPGLECALAEYESYTRGALLGQLRRVPSGDRLEEDHMRNRHLIAAWILRHARAIERREHSGKTFFAVTDREAWRQAAGALLAEVMRVKGEGDFEAARALVEGYGVTFDPALRDQVVERMRALNPPTFLGFVMPRLEAVRDAGGAIADVRISYPCDLAAQMLEWSGRAPR